MRGITACVQRVESESLRITYALEGELSQLRIPAPRPTCMGKELWQHTCFEVFIAQPGMPGYHEFNFSPSGEWAAYAFSGYRRATPTVSAIQDPQVEIRHAQGRLELDATIRLDQLLPPEAKLVAGITAVIEDAQGAFSYWALRHAPGKPDFHRAQDFILEIDAVRN